jgi:uncharacterized membrane protein
LTSPPDGRRSYIDRARGLAVLIMILAHVMDAWTRNADRDTLAFRNFTIIGGLAAPLFLWLAGLTLVLAGERAVRRSESRYAATQILFRRGLEIFVLAFLFRLQAFVLSPGGPLIAIFRVDILNVMGPALVGAGLVWGVARGPRRAAALCGGLAAAIAMATPVVRAAGWIDQLPTWFQWYLRPSGDMTTFTLFPWSGFVFAGAATGAILSMVHQPRAERLSMLAMGAGGATLIAGCAMAATLPTIYANSSFWTSSPTYFGIRLGVVMLVLMMAFAIGGSMLPWPGLNGLEQFGRRSLFIYWIHVELVYGYLTWPIHRALPVWAAAGSYLLFCAVMYRLLQLRERADSRHPILRPVRVSPVIRGGGSRGDTLRCPASTPVEAAVVERLRRLRL